MSDRLGHLLQQKEKLDAEYALAKAEAKQIKQKAKDARKGRNRAWQLSTLFLRTVLIIYAVAGYVAEPAVKFMSLGGRKRHWPDKSDEELEEMLGRFFLQHDLSELALLIDTEDPSDPVAMKAAMVCVEEWRLAAWAERLNSEIGVAPSTESVLQRWEERRAGIPEAVRPRSLGTSAVGRARVWAGSWRQRWGGRHGRIQLRGAISLEELMEKVSPNTGSQSTLFFIQRGQKTSSDLRTENVPNFEAEKRPQFRGRKTSSVSMPHLGATSCVFLSFPYEFIRKG